MGEGRGTLICEGRLFDIATYRMRLALIGGSGVIILERWRLFAGIRYGMSGSNV